MTLSTRGWLRSSHSKGCMSRKSHIILLNWRILDASDYGVPQHRDRLFCVGFLEKSIRQLTARERIRLMGFPDTFKQVVSDGQFSKQAGNSIVVKVMEALYRQMDITQYGVIS